ncbi:hypothetical protein BHM03_00054568 [Ensete ventricosum]|uniref:Uncharacterized protein n=1 Tax=Ensete ventricosum TaxID=4639 RepID=A0A445MM44_ENSVE|nr:hypothetical protein BHM03_00054568 [Ensete ventricosum]
MLISATTSEASIHRSAFWSRISQRRRRRFLGIGSGSVVVFLESAHLPEPHTHIPWHDLCFSKGTSTPPTVDSYLILRTLGSSCPYVPWEKGEIAKLREERDRVNPYCTLEYGEEVRE